VHLDTVERSLEKHFALQDKLFQWQGLSIFSMVAFDASRKVINNQCIELGQW